MSFKIELCFNQVEIKKFLLNNGFEIKKISELISEKTYHNNYCEYVVDVEKVFKDGKVLENQYGYSNIEYIFTKLLKEKLLNL